MPGSDSINDTRRQVLRAGSLLPLTVAGSGLSLPAMAASVADPVPLPPADAVPEALASDEAYWAKVAALYDVAREPVPLENGYWGVMTRAVQDSYLRHTARVNREGSGFAREGFPAVYREALAQAARTLGIGTDELALTRNATEALQALIGGYNRLRPGDAVLCADVDYDSMLSAMHWLRQRRGVDVIRIDLPGPPTHQALVDAYADALQRHPRIRMMLLTQVSHRHGLRLPVPEICAIARRHDVDVILDAAHGVGQLDMRLAGQGVDFAGVNFHKWYGAPVGVGGMYIRRGASGRIDPYMGEPDPSGSPYARVHTGTVNFAAVMALPDALAVHEAIGAARKQARLHYLNRRWLAPVRASGAYELLVPDDPRLASALVGLRLVGRSAVADNRALAARLRDEFGIQVVHRDGLASGACIRITPSLFTTPAEVDRLADALLRIAASG